MTTVYSKKMFDQVVRDLPVPDLVKKAAILGEARAFGDDLAVRHGVNISEIGNTAALFDLDYRNSHVSVEITLEYGAPGNITTSESRFFNELTGFNYRLGSEAFDLINVAYNGHLHFGAAGYDRGNAVVGDVFGPHIMSQTIVEPL